jgi:hypothetical protein
MPPWIGPYLTKNRILILGESWYGPVVHLPTYIADWSKRSQKDYLFSRIFNAASGLSSVTATLAQRQGFWDSIIFDNFVNWSVGSSRSSRPTSANYVFAASTMSSRLALLKPGVIWVLGIQQACYSRPTFGSIRSVTSPHPCGYGIKNATLVADYNKL